MKSGSVIVDLAAIGGGNCELTRKDQMFETQNGVTIIGHTDLPSRLGRQASLMFGQNMVNFIHHVISICPGKETQHKVEHVLPTIGQNLNEASHKDIDVILNCSVCVFAGA